MNTILRYTWFDPLSLELEMFFLLIYVIRTSNFDITYTRCCLYSPSSIIYIYEQTKDCVCLKANHSGGAFYRYVLLNWEIFEPKNIVNTNRSMAYQKAKPTNNTPIGQKACSFWCWCCCCSLCIHAQSHVQTSKWKLDLSCWSSFPCFLIFYPKWCVLVLFTHFTWHQKRLTDLFSLIWKSAPMRAHFPYFSCRIEIYILFVVATIS